MAAFVGGLLLAANVPGAAAQKTHYIDVEAGAYYEEAAEALLDIGALDRSESRLRPADLATRAELVKLLVRLQDEELLYPAMPSFTDVPRSAWYFPYFEAAGRAGWVRGDRNCYGTTPCTARPPDPVNRAEAAALLVRTFALGRTGRAPDFPDNPTQQWYYPIIQTAADHCVLQGDGGTGRVRPASFMNRAEMIVMFHRAYQNLEYGVDCGVSDDQAPGIDSASALSAFRIRVIFSENVDTSRADDAERYTIERVSGGGTITVRSVTVVNSRTVELQLENDLDAGVAYRVMASNLRSEDGVMFTASERFTFSAAVGNITDVSTLSTIRVRVTFDADLDAARAEDESRYSVRRLGSSLDNNVTSAILVDDNMVELRLEDDLIANASYILSVDNLRTDGGVTFSDSTTFVYPIAGGHITDVTTSSTVRVQILFDTNLDRTRAEDESRYIVRRLGGVRNNPIITATLIDNDTVELRLESDLIEGASYLLSVQDMRTAAGVTFSDSTTFVFPSEMGRIMNIDPISALRFRVTYDVAVDDVRAEERQRYELSDGNRLLSISSVRLVSDRSVEVLLNETLKPQRSYTLTVTDMETAQGVEFDDAEIFVYEVDTVSLTANLTGSQEVPPVITLANGAGTFTLRNDGLHYDITVQNLTGAITASHFHIGRTGIAGPIAETITFQANRSVGVWSDLTQEERNAILDNGVYVSVHTAQNPNGEIRGQLQLQ